MISKCPKCGKDIEHEDFLFEVRCEQPNCGTRFNPFMLQGAASAEPPPEPEAQPEGPGPSLMTEGDAMGAAAAEVGFQESQEAFQEIQQYGEALAETPPGSPPPPTTSPKAAAKKAAVAPLEPGAECPISAGDSLPGYTIDALFMPVSACSKVEAASESPFHGAFQGLWQQAQSVGATGIIGLRWTLTPDGGKVFASGTPVRCSK